MDLMRKRATECEICLVGKSIAMVRGRHRLHYREILINNSRASPIERLAAKQSMQ